MKRPDRRLAVAFSLVAFLVFLFATLRLADHSTPLDFVLWLAALGMLSVIPPGVLDLENEPEDETDDIADFYDETDPPDRP